MSANFFMLNKAALSSKLSVLALIILALFFAQLKFRQRQNQALIEREKTKLENQAGALQKNNEELSQSLSYLNSADFKERVARQQLNLKKQGETIYTFGSPPQNSENGDSQAKISNFDKWRNYFFGSD